MGFLRREEYRVLLKGLGNPVPYAGFYNGPFIGFGYSDGALLAIGPEWSEEIVYSPREQPADQLVKNIDGFGEKDYGTYAQRLDQNWYLVFRNVD